MGTNSDKYKNLSFLRKHAFDIDFQIDPSKYRLGDRIGAGAFGVVCVAEQLLTGKRTAIKKIPDALSSTVVMKRTYREICILRHFSHENVISILDLLLPNKCTIQEARDIYVVLDFMETDLHRLIASDNRLEEDHIKYLMYQLFCGLHYIHSAGVIHRDLKPANLLVNSNCRLKIGDFGMARAISATADMNTRYKLTQYVMTRWYRAPELLMGQLAYCTAVDLWSCGCIMAEMYTRRPLFPGTSEKDQFCQLVQHMGTPPGAFMEKILPHYMKTVIRSFGTKQPRPLNQLVPQASRKALDLLGRLLVYEPEKRASARQALGHVFLNKYRQPNNEPTCPTMLDFSFDTELTGSDSGERYKMALLREVQNIQNPHMFDHDYVRINRATAGNAEKSPKDWECKTPEDSVKQIGATTVRVLGIVDTSTDNEFPMISADTPETDKMTRSQPDDVLTQAALMSHIVSARSLDFSVKPSLFREATGKTVGASKTDAEAKDKVGEQPSVAKATGGGPLKRPGRRTGGTNWPDQGNRVLSISAVTKEKLQLHLSKPKESLTKRSRGRRSGQYKKDRKQKRLQTPPNARNRRKKSNQSSEDEISCEGYMGIARSKDDVLCLERWERLYSMNPAQDNIGKNQANEATQPDQAEPKPGTSKDVFDVQVEACSESRINEPCGQNQAEPMPKSASSLDNDLQELLGEPPPVLEPFNIQNIDDQMQVLSAQMDSALNLVDEQLPSLVTTPKGSGTAYGININLQDLVSTEMSSVFTALKSPEDAEVNSVTNFLDDLENWSSLLSDFGIESEVKESDIPEVERDLDNSHLLTKPQKADF